MGKQWKQCQTLFFWAPKSLQMVTAAMKLKDAYSLEGKLWLTSVSHSVQSLSRVLLFATPWIAARQASMSITNSRSSLKLTSNLDSIFKSRDITLPTKVRLAKAIVFTAVIMDVRVGLWRRLSTEELMLLNCGVGEDSWESLGLQGDLISPF